MKKELKIHVKIGDNVTVISGFHKTKNGEIIKINKTVQLEDFINLNKRT